MIIEIDLVAEESPFFKVFNLDLKGSLKRLQHFAEGCMLRDIVLVYGCHDLRLL